jgi:hypothetical protein
VIPARTIVTPERQAEVFAVRLEGRMESGGLGFGEDEWVILI